MRVWVVRGNSGGAHIPLVGVPKIDPRQTQTHKNNAHRHRHVTYIHTKNEHNKGVNPHGAHVMSR
jgi:hypothetical protein